MNNEHNVIQNLDCRIKKMSFKEKERTKRKLLGIFLFTTVFRMALGAHAASYPIDTRGSFPGGKAAGS
jgi:hypothetical protein